MTVTLKFKHDVLQSEIYTGSQSWNLVHVVRAVKPDNGNEGARFRAVIHRDGYDAQSFVRAERFSAGVWQQVAFLPIGESHTWSVSYVDKKSPTDAFHADATEVLNLAFDIAGA